MLKYFLDNEFIARAHDYGKLMQQSTLFMLEKAYGELLLFDNIGLDIKRLSRSLTEKTNILANHMKTPYITKYLHQLMNRPQGETFSKEQVLDILDETITNLEDSIEKESLELLKEELVYPSRNQAIIKGLVENIKYHSNCKWIAYALRSYFQMK